MNFLDNHSQHFLKNLIKNISDTPTYIIFCDDDLKLLNSDNLNIGNLSFKKDTDLRDIFPNNVCKDILKVFKNPCTITSFCVLENLQMEIKIFNFDSTGIVVLRQVELSVLPKLTNYHTEKRLYPHLKFLESCTKNQNYSNEELSKYKNMFHDLCNLSLFNEITKSLNSHTDEDFYTCNFSLIFKILAEEISSFNDSVSINLKCDNDILCHVNPYQISVLILNIVSNIFKYSGVDHTIYFTLYKKLDKIHVYIKTRGFAFPNNISLDLLDFPYNKNQKYLQFINVNFPTIKKIVENHKGTLMLSSDKGFSSIYFSIPVHLQDAIDDDSLTSALKKYIEFLIPPIFPTK